MSSLMFCIVLSLFIDIFQLQVLVEFEENQAVFYIKIEISNDPREKIRKYSFDPRCPIVV